MLYTFFKEKYLKNNVVRTIVQILFLILFAVLIVIGKLQMWFIIFGLGVLVTPFFGRLYCGWICPMNTLFKPIDWFYKKTKIKRLNISDKLNNHFLRYLMLALFLGIMILVKKLHLPIPVLALITGLSIIITLFVEEALWHNMLCPFGTILNIAGKISMKHYKINQDACIACGKCEKVCPVHAIKIGDNKKRYIIKSMCISCGRCVKACPTLAIAN